MTAETNRFDGSAKNASVGHASLALIALIFSCLVAVIAIWLHSSYQTTVTRGEERVNAAAKIVAANANWLNSLAGETLHRIDDSLGPQVPPFDDQHVHDLNRAIEDLPSLSGVFVMGTDGKVLFSNQANARGVYAGDRDYFIRLRNGAEENTSSLLISRVTQRQVFVFSRRLERGGRFSGIAVIAFDADILKPIWDAVGMGKNSTVSLIRRDGQLVVRQPAPPGPVDMSNYVLFTDYMRKATSGVYRSSSPIDNSDRLVAYRIIERTPFVAIASADENVIMAPFWYDAKIAGLLLLFSLAGSLASAIWIRNLIIADTRHLNQLSEALEANKVLMRDIHHRVKNNLQTVTALIRMQGFDRQLVDDLTERIAAMSAVHEQIYGFDQFSGVAAGTFIPSFVDTLVNVHHRAIRTTFDVEEITIDPDRATPFALLLNEVISNCMKYAFIDRTEGTISVALQRNESGEAVLTIADDGVGFDGLSLKPGMGTKLIQAFVRQLGGSSRYHRQNGTIFTAELRLVHI